MKYKNLQEKIENINLDNLSEDDVLQIETTIKELISLAKSFDQSLIDEEIKKSINIFAGYRIIFLKSRGYSYIKGPRFKCTQKDG